MSEINNYDPNNYDPNPYDDVTIDEALAQIYDRVNDRTIRQIVTILKKVIDGISTGDISRYTVEKTTAESGEVTYKLMQQINNGIPTPVGDTVSLRGSQILANYGEELQVLDNIINIIKVALDSKADAADIPTVPITAIKKNGTAIMPVDGTVNITVPVVATDVAALPDTTKYAAALSLTIDSATFIVTGQLKDQNGDNLGAAQTIDLPLESVVVGGSYNSQTQKVVLTLQNGNTIEFSVADLVYGLQTELSETNKLNPAYINYDSTHRAVSDTEKSEWNGKQDVIDSSHKLSADFVDDTNAANKFATEEELEQIETNKNNISKLDYGVHDISCLGAFAIGGLGTDGSLKPEQTARVSSTNTITFPDYDAVLLADAGYAIGYIPFVNGTAGTWTGWLNGKIIIPANTVLKFQISPKIYLYNAQATISDVATLTKAIKISGHNMSTIDNFITGNGSADSAGDDIEQGAPVLNRLITNYIDVNNIDSIIVSIASDYSYGFHSYDENFVSVSNSSNWITATSDYDLSAVRYIRINVKANDNSNISPTDNIGLKISNKLIFSASDKSYNYNGIVNIANSYRANTYATYTPTTALPTKTQQGMAIYNGMAFLLYDRGGLAIYDLIRKQAIAEITLACAGTDNHCNSANFSTEIISGGTYPLLYISECYGQHRCFVENITNESSTTIQTITFANDNGDYTNSTYNNAFDWILDNDTGMLMTYGLMSDGKHKIKMFAKPNTSNANVTLHETDVVEEWIVEDNIYPALSSNYVYQGNCAKGGIIYLLTYQSNEIICIDENTHEMTARVPLTFNTSGEPEDLAIYADTMFVVYGDKKIYGMSFD